jgi:hypothetical protein
VLHQNLGFSGLAKLENGQNGGRRVAGPTGAVPGSATRVAGNQRQGQRQQQRPRQRQGQDQGQRQRAASGSDTVSDSGHGHGRRSRTKPVLGTEHPPTNPSPQTPAHAPHDQPVRPDTKPCENRTMAQRVLVHISRSEQRVIDPDDVYCLVATGGETEVRLRGRTPLIDMRPLGEVLPERCRAHESWVLMDSDPAAASGIVLSSTGLPSRSALVAPPLRLAALRWREAFVVLGRYRPPPGVSTAFLVAVTRFSDSRFPRVPPLRMCPSMLEASAAHSQGRHARRCANSRAQRGP